MVRGLAVFINDLWCRDACTILKHCSPDVEFMVVKCQPFHLPREFTAAFITAVYVPPSADKQVAMNKLYDNISRQQIAHPDALYIFAGDFNKACLKNVLPKHYQHVNYATRGNNTKIKDTYRPAPLPHIGSSDHLTVTLQPQ